MGEQTPDLAAYDRYWQPRRLRLLRRLQAIWHSVRERLSGSGSRGGGASPDPPWIEPALVPRGPRRGPRPSGAVALEPPDDDDWDGDVVAYPKEID